MMEDLVGNNGTRFIAAAGAVAIGLICLVAVLWFIKNRPSSPFIRGGKNRQPRLAVLDAAAVDTRRRLVLVRRDDVEHLIMIGGPTDIVIESRITGQPAAPANVTVAVETPAAPRPAVERRATPPQPQPQQEARPVPVDARTPPVSAMGQVLYGDAAEPAQVRQPATQPATRPAAQTPQRPVTPERQELPRPAVAASPAPPIEVQTLRAPEDILDAARNRVLVPENPSQRPAPAKANPQPPTAQTGVPPLPAPVQKNTSAADFERFLDAEITGDLQKLTPSAESRLAPPSRPQGAAQPGTRQEPSLGSPGSDVRKEPSLEEEMNRMLGEIAVKKN